MTTHSNSGTNEGKSRHSDVMSCPQGLELPLTEPSLSCICCSVGRRDEEGRKILRVSCISSPGIQTNVDMLLDSTGWDHVYSQGCKNNAGFSPDVGDVSRHVGSTRMQRVGKKKTNLKVQKCTIITSLKMPLFLRPKKKKNTSTSLPPLPGNQISQQEVKKVQILIGGSRSRPCGLWC